MGITHRTFKLWLVARATREVTDSHQATKLRIPPRFAQSALRLGRRPVSSRSTPMRGEGSGRRQPAGSAAPGDGEPWECSMNPDEARNRCDIAEERLGRGEQEVEGEALGSEDDLDEESEVEEAVAPQPDDDDDDDDDDLLAMLD